jgi:hypothetical protein
MNEALQYARLIHTLLIGTAATVLGFALSAEDLGQYDRLLAALKRLESNITVDAAAFDRHKSEVVDRETKFAFHLNRALKGLGIRISKDLRRENYPYIHYSLADPLKVTSMGGGLEGRTATTRDRTIREIALAFSDERPAVVFKPDDAFSEITAWLRPFRQMGAQLVAIRLGGLQSAGRKHLESYFELKIPAAQYAGNRDRLNAEMKELRIRPRVTDDMDPVVISVDLRIYGDEMPVPNETLGGWLAHRAGGPSNPARDALRKTLFPDLVLAAPELSNVSVPDAQLQVVQRKAAAIEKQRVSLFGIDLRAQVAVLLAPALTLLLVLLFLSHLLNIRPRDPEQAAQVAAFAWIGLFRDILSRLLLLSSMLLPLLAVFVLLRNLGFPEANQARIISRVVIGALLLSTCGALWRLWKLQHIARDAVPAAAAAASAP